MIFLNWNIGQLNVITLAIIIKIIIQLFHWLITHF